MVLHLSFQCMCVCNIPYHSCLCISNIISVLICLPCALAHTRSRLAWPYRAPVPARLARQHPLLMATGATVSTSSDAGVASSPSVILRFFHLLLKVLLNSRLSSSVVFVFLLMISLSFTERLGRCFTRWNSKTRFLIKPCFLLVRLNELWMIYICALRYYRWNCRSCGRYMVL